MSPPVPALAAPLGLLTLLGLLTACTVLGRGIRRLAVRADPADRGSRPTLYALAIDFATGLLSLHLLLLGLQALGIRWTALSVGGGLGLVQSLLLLARRVLARRLRTPPTSHPTTGEARGRRSFARSFTRSLPRSWGDAVALLTVLAFTAAAWSLRTTHPDFIYHWGIKAKKFLLDGGLDFRYLGRTWNHFVHPDYPTLVPELYTVTSLPGGFSEPALLLWSAVFFAALLVALREALDRSTACRSATDPFVRQAGLAFLALGLTAFAVGHRLAGGADLPLAFAFAAALPTLLAPRASGSPEADLDDWSLGIAAAFAAAVKIEGVLLAATLVALHGFRRWREGRHRGRLARIALPALAVVLPWLAIDLRYDLFQAFNSGPFEAERWAKIVAALADGLAVRHWHGLSYLVLAAPLLLLARRTRPVATVVVVQLVFYLWVFFTLVGDAEQLVRLSLPRLLLPLVPAVAVAGLSLRTPRRPRRHTG